MDGVTIEGIEANTPDEVAGWLGRALEITGDLYGEAEVPPAVTVKVLELLATKHVITRQPQQVPLSPEMARALQLGRGGH